MKMPKSTSHLLIREFVKADADLEFDPRVKNYIGSIQQSKEDWANDAKIKGIRGWVIEAKLNGKFVGRVAVYKEDVNYSQPGIAAYEILIANKFWGKGYGKEVSDMVIPATFKEAYAIAIVAEVHPQNSAVISLLKSDGFSYENDSMKSPMKMYRLNAKKNSNA